MIGVLFQDGELTAVQEFFQLFKTPWEPYTPGSSYEVLISTRADGADYEAQLVVAYHSGRTKLDDKLALQAESRRAGGEISCQHGEIPIYGYLSTISAKGATSGECVKPCHVCSALDRQSGAQVVRIGYDLFQEVAYLLSQGQPVKHAYCPALEFHIAMLREIMLKAKISFLEIPPFPAGYDFMACLTHDVDFTGIREHKFDHTMWGFVYRALAGSLLDAARGRLSWSKCRTNWRAALSLPLVYSGLKKDFWLEFDRYLEIERDLGSTFFFLPYMNRPGTLGTLSAPKRRAAKYDLAGMRDQLTALVKECCEVGLHGIDAWQDVEQARAERDRVSQAGGQPVDGVRMHWLYFDENSPKVLQEAGFSYDSSYGYNDAVGFRAGTAQPFCMAPATSLLELPLIVQDTALFYSGRMHLSEDRALDACHSIIEAVARVGGAITINWHTRSLSPERLWGDFYLRLLDELEKYRVWYATASEIVSWFRRRRALRFERSGSAQSGWRVRVSGEHVAVQPPFVVRIHRALADAPRPAETTFSDLAWNGEAEFAPDESEDQVHGYTR
jgi:hypothetical protein